MGRELMRTLSRVVPVHGGGHPASEPALDGPGASARVAVGGTTVLRDARVRGAIGNRAVGRMLSSQPAPSRTKKKPEPETSRHSGAEFDIPGDQYEYAYRRSPALRATLPSPVSTSS